MNIAYTLWQNEPPATLLQTQLTAVELASALSSSIPLSTTLDQRYNSLQTGWKLQTDRYPTVLHTEEDQLLLEKGKGNTTAIQPQISRRRREERRGQSRGDKMQANAKTLGDVRPWVRPSAAVSGAGQQRATQEWNKRTNETWLFLH